MPKKSSSRAGRKPIIYNEYIENSIIALHSEGMSFTDICKKLGFSLSTLNRFRKENKNLAKCISDNATVLAQNVENSLYLKATGYDRDETTTHKDKEGNIKGTSIKSRHYPPDTEAIKFYLTNIAPDKYKNRQNLDANIRPIVKRQSKRFDGAKIVDNQSD